LRKEKPFKDNKLGSRRSDFGSSDALSKSRMLWRIKW